MSIKKSVVAIALAATFAAPVFAETYPVEGQLPGFEHPNDGQVDRPMAGGNNEWPDFNQPTEEEGQIPEVTLPETSIYDSLQDERLDSMIEASNANDAALGEEIANNSAAIDELYAQGNKNTADIEKLFGEVDRLDGRIDAIGASAQAVAAARPHLGVNQTSAIGAGLGYMGSATALSVGYAHAINENWSANANVATTFGTDDSEFSAGAGISYAWN